MTLNETMELMLKNETDEKKIRCLEEIGEFLIGCNPSEKIDGRRLFELTEKLVKEWPELVTVLVALSYVASVGLKDADVDPKEIADTVDLSEFMTEE